MSSTWSLARERPNTSRIPTEVQPNARSSGCATDAANRYGGGAVHLAGPAGRHLGCADHLSRSAGCLYSGVDSPPWRIGRSSGRNSEPDDPTGYHARETLFDAEAVAVRSGARDPCFGRDSRDCGGRSESVGAKPPCDFVRRPRVEARAAPATCVWPPRSADGSSLGDAACGRAIAISLSGSRCIGLDRDRDRRGVGVGVAPCGLPISPLLHVADGAWILEALDGAVTLGPPPQPWSSSDD